jgi:hypothetical protein
MRCVPVGEQRILVDVLLVEHEHVGSSTDLAARYSRQPGSSRATAKAILCNVASTASPCPGWTR